MLCMNSLNWAMIKTMVIIAVWFVLVFFVLIKLNIIEILKPYCLPDFLYPTLDVNNNHAVSPDYSPVNGITGDDDSSHYL